MPTTLFRDCPVLRDARGRFDPTRQDILVDADRIAAIKPAGILAGADDVVDAAGTLAAAGMINGHFEGGDRAGRTPALRHPGTGYPGLDCLIFCLEIRSA